MKILMFPLVKLFLIIPFLWPGSAYPQKPEKVYSFVKIDKPFEWYLNQAALWKKVIDVDPKNAGAWLNFYTANRMASKIDAEAWQNNKGPSYMELDQIVGQMSIAIPGTYEYYYVRVWNDGYQNEQNSEYLLKAYAMSPDRTEIYSSLVNYYEMKRDHEHEAEICRKWYNSNEPSPNILAYNYNVLQSLDDNGILITNGDNDTYPLWILQYALGIKKQVVVVNINLITVDDYRKQLYAENGIPADDFKALEQPRQENIIRHLIERSGRPVYFAGTLNTSFYQPYQKDLYLVGLAFKYSSESFDNMAIMRNNYERKFRMDYIKLNLSKDISQGIADRMNMGYLPFLIKLHEHYSLSGEVEKASGVRELAGMIAKRADPEMKVDEWFHTK